MPMDEHANHRNTHSPEDCTWRVVLTGDGSETARCRLLEHLFGPRKKHACTVTRDVCASCCNSFPPTFESLNPVVASLVYDRAEALALAEGKSGEQQRLQSLRPWAEKYLEIEAPPLPPLPRQTHEPAAQRLSGPVRPLTELLPRPSARCGEPVRHWAVGVTTAPRRRSRLDECLHSLAGAGWPRPHLFVDGSVTISSEWSFLPRTSRDEQVGAWPNYYLSLLELLMREPLADAFLLVQDDALFYDRDNIRQYLEQILWPGEVSGIVSLYCAAPDTQKQAGWFKYPGRWRFGAVALIFPREIAQRLVISPSVFHHRWTDGVRGQVGIPDVIAEWAAATSTPFYYPTPSLTQHIGETSAIWLGAYNLTPKRSAGDFLGDHTGPPARVCDSEHAWRDEEAAVFPEADFPCVPGCEADYARRIDAGRRRMAGASAVVCGLCRDTAPNLPGMIARVERLAGMFHDCGIVVYENDSVDGTPDLLRQWAASNPAVQTVSERLQQPKIDYGVSRDRTERMAYYRNRCRDRVLAEFGHYDFVIVVDFDLRGGWSYDGIAHTFGHEAWDFVGSNGLHSRSVDAPGSFYYHDAFAHRAVGQRTGSADRLGLQFRRGEPLVPVWSCFGGLGVYRMDCYKAAGYDGADCEHVTLHLALRERGFDRLFLNPSQIVLYSPWRTAP